MGLVDIDRVSDMGMEFGAILDRPINGVSDVDLALEVGKAKNLLDQMQEEYQGYVERVRAECLRQDAARQEKLASVGLTGLPLSKPSGKRGRKSKADKEAEALANAENEAVAFEEDELASGGSALLDAE
jgi:hypothetical protein